MDDRTDDMSTGIKLQQFMDEWYYRCIHSGLANDWDREKCAVAALDLFELQGVVISKEDKEPLAALDDDTFIEAVVKRMPEDIRRTFEHFALQLQLVMSAASRVRCALEEGTPEEVARIMDEGDQGVNSEILKQTIVEATVEAGEVREIHDGWEASMSKRLSRLGQCQYETEMSRMELDKLNVRLGSFGKEQNSKAKGVLLGMASTNDRTLMQTVFKTWWQHKVRFFAEKSIHEKFQKEIEDTQKSLMDYKAAQVNNVRSVLTRSADASDKRLLSECFRVWIKDLQDEKEARSARGHVEHVQQRMGNLKAAQKANAKKSMMRLGAANEDSMKSMVFQAWISFREEEKKARDFEVQVKAQQEKMQQFMAKKSKEAKGVLTKMAGASEGGLLFAALQAWMDDVKGARKAREAEEFMNKQMTKLANLNTRQKSNANSSAQKANGLEAENTMMHIFMNWHIETLLGRLIRFYSGQMDAKGKQLEAVQSMFKTFAQQLEHGISTTPRTNRKGASKSKGGEKEGSSRPPQQPRGAAS
mmetsp:Transcript_74225/g.172168  ORF Transcript_74225/g.172168 Transcript_74225/m.172168 type:complete len:531 (+) Transcript_74225:3-1595(+)